MGIKSLNKFLRNNCINIFEEIHISEYAYKKVAIDISLYLYKFKRSCGDTWLSVFLNLICCLRKNEIHCVFIYDNGAPPEKDLEKIERRKQRENNEMKLYILEEALKKYYNSGQIEECLIELDMKEKNKMQKRLLETKNNINIKFIESKIEKMKGYTLNITPSDFIITKKLLEILNIPYYDAPLEAETMCADLCKRGIVDAVLSEDTDVLAYGCPFFLSKINTSRQTCIRISYTQLLENIKLNGNEFLDLCIMCGTDYNKNISGIGPEKAYKYILNCKSIENIKEIHNLDISILNYETSRKLFLEYKRSDIETIPYCGQPNFEKLKEFLFKNNVYLNIEALKLCFLNNIIIIE